MIPPHLIKQILCRIFSLLVLFWACSGQAQELIIERAVFEDPSAQMTVAEVANQQFTPFGNLLSKGYTDSALWIRIQVKPHPEGKPIKIRARPTYLDQVWLYEPQFGHAGGWVERRSGDRQPFSSSDRSANSFGFLLQPQQAPTTYYLRLKTTSTALLRVEAWGTQDAIRQDAILMLFQLAYAAFVTWFAIWSLQEYLQTRERLMLYCALFQGVNIVLVFVMTGYFSVFEASQDGWVDQFTSVVIFMGMFFGILFNRSFLMLYQPNRWLSYGFLILVLLIPFQFITYFMGYQRFALEMNIFVLLTLGGLMFVCAFALQKEGIPSRRVVRFIYTLQFVNILLSTVPFLGWVNAFEWGMQASTIHGIFAAIFMFFILKQRTRLLRSQADENRQNAVLMKQQLQLSGQHIAEQDRFIDMLTHEIKTPMSVALLSLGAAKLDSPYVDRAKRALNNLDDIVSRIRLSAQTEGNRMVAKVGPCNASVLVYDSIEMCSAPERVKAFVGFELMVITDSQLLTIILTNLIENALKYSRLNSLIEVELAQSDVKKGVYLTVRNLIGAAGAPDLTQVFSKYYRSRGAASQSGSGLGLFLSHNLAQLIGARLNCQTNADTVEFSLWLPSSNA